MADTSVILRPLITHWRMDVSDSTINEWHCFAGNSNVYDLFLKFRRHAVMLDLIHWCVSREELQHMKFYKLKKWARTNKEFICIQWKMLIYCSLAEVKLIARWAGQTRNETVYHISFFDSLRSWFLLVCCLNTWVQVKSHKIVIISNYLFGWK